MRKLWKRSMVNADWTMHLKIGPFGVLTEWGLYIVAGFGSPRFKPVDKPVHRLFYCVLEGVVT